MYILYLSSVSMHKVDIPGVPTSHVSKYTRTPHTVANVAKLAPVQFAPDEGPDTP